MKIIDANVVLRYLLQDIEELFNKAVEVIEREDIDQVLKSLMLYSNISVGNKELIKTALQLFSSRRLDFVDTL